VGKEGNEDMGCGERRIGRGRRMGRGNREVGKEERGRK
jgi:hypothetical protein